MEIVQSLTILAHLHTQLMLLLYCWWFSVLIIADLKLFSQLLIAIDMRFHGSSLLKIKEKESNLLWKQTKLSAFIFRLLYLKWNEQPFYRSDKSVLHAFNS